MDGERLRRRLSILGRGFVQNHVCLVGQADGPQKQRVRFGPFGSKSTFCTGLNSFVSLQPQGGLAQLARALAWHARGHRFDSDILHSPKGRLAEMAFFCGFLVLYLE